MKKRIAYIGLSYPLRFDYRNQASHSPNDLYDSPNPIIDSPLGLLIMYDELWFLCESVCPNNMRKLPYVKFVDQMFGDFYFEGAYKAYKDTWFDMDFPVVPNSFFHIDERFVCDFHTHTLKIGNVNMSAESRTIVFDMYVFEGLKARTEHTVEWVSNSLYALDGTYAANTEPIVAEEIIINNIPNYLSVKGPYHPCFEQLRENNYLRDFRKWIVENHSTIQSGEIKDISVYVEKAIEENKNKVFKKYLDDNSDYKFSLSTGKTVITTGVGLVCPIVSIVDGLNSIIQNLKKRTQATNDRWQGFVIDSHNVLNNTLNNK